MELKLEKETLRRCTCVYTGEHTQEETVEAVISDTMPDAAEVLEAQAKLFLRSKESREGRVQLRFALEGTLLYRSEGENKLCTLELKSDCPVDWEDDTMAENVRLLAWGRVCRVEGRLLNPRKLQLRCVLIAGISEWSERETEVSIGTEEDSLQLKMEKKMLSYVSAVGEKTFVLSENLNFPETAEPMRELLLTRTESFVEESQSVAGKLLLRGCSVVELLYLNPEGQAAAPQRLSLQWSQLLDVGEGGEHCRVYLMPTALYVDPGLDDSGVAVELHLTAQALCFTEREISYVADAYSTAGETELFWEELGRENGLMWETVEETFRASAAAPLGATAVLQSFAEVGKRQNEGYPILFHCLLLTADGLLVSVEQEHLLSCGEMPVQQQSRAELSGGKVEFLVSALKAAECGEESDLRFVSGITLSEEKSDRKGCRSTLVAVRAEGCELWELARKYGSTVELIEQANANRDERDLYLFIPRAR